MSKKAEQAPVKAFLSSDLNLYLKADVEAISATQGQVDNIVALANDPKLDAEQVKLYISTFENRVQKARLLTEGSLNTAKSQRKFILHFALGITKLQKANPDKWTPEASKKVMADLAKRVGSLSAFYRELRATAKAEQDKPEPTDGDKLAKALESFKEAGHSKAEVLALVDKLFS
jgi:hypothetical protein